MFIQVVTLLTLPFHFWSAIEDEGFTNRAIIAHNLDGRGVVDINHFGGIMISEPNKLNLSPKQFDAISKLLASQSGIDEFLSKAASPTECLVV